MSNSNTVQNSKIEQIALDYVNSEYPTYSIEDTDLCNVGGDGEILIISASCDTEIIIDFKHFRVCNARFL